jgi:hypothetical protein
MTQRQSVITVSHSSRWTVEIARRFEYLGGENNSERVAEKST